MASTQLEDCCVGANYSATRNDSFSLGISQFILCVYFKRIAYGAKLPLLPLFEYGIILLLQSQRGESRRVPLLSRSGHAEEFDMDMVEVSIDSIRVSLVSHHRIVVLKDPEDRYLPIWIGPFEADAITIALQGGDVARPLTHDLMRNLIAETGASASHILVSDLRDEIFFARIVLDVDGRHVEVDSRPSDAIALAVRLKCPI